MRTIAALLLVLQLVSSAFGQCGPAQCYSGCTDARVPLDLIFLVDISGSMQDKINGVISGLTQFANDLSSKSVIPWYNLITFGDGNDRAVVVLNGESNSATFKTRMSQISVGGGWEPALETIRRAGNTAASGNFNLNLRPGSKRALILVTDEDSDAAYFSANRFQSSGNDGREACPPSDWSQWQNEINAAYTAIANIDASSYFLVSVDTSTSFRTSQTCLTRRQFGDFNLQTQSLDYKTFDAADTLNRLNGASLGNSLQARLLSNGKYSRVFKVELTTDSTFIKNFFQTITADVSTCDTKCTIYPCSLGTCQKPQYICGCDGVPNSGATLDPWGACCTADKKDCTGKCNGKSVYDECGVCGTSRSPLCVKDCKDQWYLTSKPSSVYTTPDSFQPNPAGYLLMNSDLYTQFATNGGSLRSVDLLKNHFHSFGRFEGRYSCVFDASRYATQYGVSASTAENDWLSNLLSTSTTKRQAFCVANSRIKLPPALVDACSQCILTPDSPPYCAKDCSGVLRVSAASAFFIDNCGSCVAPGTNPDAKKDFCGVCSGGNSTMNQCGECYGSKALDKCDNPVCKGIACNINCEGKSEVTLTKALDECGICVAINTRSPDCLTDCNGKFYKRGDPPQFKVDECGVCVTSSITRSPDCIQDCSGKWNGTAYYDKCGQCIDGVNDFPCIQDCNGDYYRRGADTPARTLDDCNECNTPQNQNKLKDKCGVCTNKAGYNSTAECTPDCKGIWTLATQPRSFTDFCGDCWFANQSQFNNYRMDDCGFCYNSRDDPNWNKDRLVDSQGNRCACFQPLSTCVNYFTGKSYDSCNDCPPANPCNGTNALPDSCGLCPGKSMYGKKDKCDMCCSPEDGVPCDVDIDDCGVCFGLNKQKQQNKCNICDSSKCVIDCNGTPNGTAVVGCDGICGSNAVCLTCGDGIISPEIGETCDLGNGKNTKGSGCYNCVTEKGNSGGAIAGGVIGGVAAVAFLGVAGFFAYKYAEKNGLIGKVGKNVDFSGSNNNPLYTSDTSVKANPLYGH